MTPNPEYDESKEVDGGFQHKYICPVTSIEFTGLTQFVVLWTTGHVLSDRALREIGIEGLQNEYGPFTAEDVVRLLPLEDELPAVIAAMNQRRERLKTMKKSSKKRSSETKIDSSELINGSNTNNRDGGHENVSSHTKKKKSSDHAADVTSHPSDSIGSVSAVATTVRHVNEALQKREETSAVFKSLFHKGHEADKHDRDLFMSVAGLRYTIG